MVAVVGVIESDLLEGESLREYRRAYDATTAANRRSLRARLTEGRGRARQTEFAAIARRPLPVFLDNSDTTKAGW